ncbi:MULTISPECIES: hypothetical protein [Acinetobacter]|uniref:hypothetical protein n=1 Tax=Acinetobacter TaxID=469 RepID=UPI001D0DE2B3|nr:MULTISPECIES: hypothetical protein [Acinetobacter]
MNPIIDFKSKTQVLDTLKSECIYLDMSKFAHIYSDSILNPMGVYPKLDAPLKYFIVVFLVALRNFRSYICRALSKISKLALAGYKLRGVQPTFHSGFFVRYISMRPHIYVELGRDIFGCAGNLVVLSANPFKLHTNHLAVICEAPQLQGVH